MKKILSTLLAFTIACSSYVGAGGINTTSSIVYANSFSWGGLADLVEGAVSDDDFELELDEGALEGALEGFFDSYDPDGEDSLFDGLDDYLGSLEDSDGDSLWGEDGFNLGDYFTDDDLTGLEDALGQLYDDYVTENTPSQDEIIQGLIESTLSDFSEYIDSATDIADIIADGINEIDFANITDADELAAAIAEVVVLTVNTITDDETLTDDQVTALVKAATDVVIDSIEATVEGMESFLEENSGIIDDIITQVEDALNPEEPTTPEEENPTEPEVGGTQDFGSTTCTLGHIAEIGDYNLNIWYVNKPSSINYDTLAGKFTSLTADTDVVLQAYSGSYESDSKDYTFTISETTASKAFLVVGTNVVEFAESALRTVSGYTATASVKTGDEVYVATIADGDAIASYSISSKEVSTEEEPTVTLPTPTITIENDKAEVDGTISVSASYGDDNTEIDSFTWTIDGETQTGSSYTIASTDAGKTLKVVVTIAELADKYQTTTSTKSITIPEAPETPLPEIEGKAKVGLTLTASLKDDNGNDIDFDTNSGYSFIWYTCNEAGTTKEPISGATSSTFKVTSTQYEKYIMLGITYDGEEIFSTVTSQVVKQTFAADQIKFVNFENDDTNFRVGQTLKVVIYDEDGIEIEDNLTELFTFEWYYKTDTFIGAINYRALDDGYETINETPILTLTEDHISMEIAVKVTLKNNSVTNALYESVTDSSGNAISNMSVTTTPILSEDGEEYLTNVSLVLSNDGKTLTATRTGISFTTDTAYTFEWFVNGTTLSSASKYTLDIKDTDGGFLHDIDFGDKIKVVVTPTDANTKYIASGDYSSATYDVLPQLTTPTIDKTGPVDKDDVLSISNSTDYTDLDVTFKWYVGNETDGFTEGGTGTTFTVKDEHSGKNIYVVATISTNADKTHEDSEASSSVTVNVVKYSVSYVLDTLLATGNEGDEVEYGKAYTTTLSVASGFTDTHSLPVQSDITVTMDGKAITFGYSNGTISINSVTGNVTIEATAATDTPDAGTSTPTIVLDPETMYGVTSSRTTLTNADLNDDGNYEFTLSADKLPEDINVIFTATVTMALADGFEYDKSTGIVTIDPSRFSASMGYFATITGTWDSAGNTNDKPSTSSYSVKVTASGTGITDINSNTQTTSAGSPMNITLATSTGYKTPIAIESITMGSTTLTTSDYSINGNTLTIKAGTITEDCSLVIVANATADSATTHKVSLYLGNYINLDDSVVNYVTSGENYELTLLPADGYSLPDTITVTMGTDTLTNGVSYFYSSSTGKVEVTNVTGDLTITVGAATNAVTYTVTHELENATFVSGDAAGSFTEGSTYTAIFASKDGYYSLIDNNVSITGDCDYDFNVSTGELKIINIQSNITIHITADYHSSTHSLWFSLYGLYNDNLTGGNNYTINVDDGESYTATLYPKDDYELMTSTDNVKIKYTRSGEYVDTDDYTVTINDTSVSIAMSDITESLKIYAYAENWTDDDDSDTDSDGDNDDSSSSSTYTITFVDISGNTVTTLTTGTNKTLSYLPTLSVSDGYVFVGWYTSGGTKISTSTVFSGDRTIYPKVIAISTPTYDSGTNYYISTSSSDIAIYADKLLGGTITITGTNYVKNLVIVPPYSNYTISNTTNIVIPDSNGNTAMWTITAGSQIDDDNYLNLGVTVSESPIHTSTTLGRALGYVDFAHDGNLLESGTGLAFTFRNYQVSTSDTLQFYKLDDYSDFVGNYNSASAIGNYYVRTTMYTCSRWELIARNYSYSPGVGGGDGYYTQYYNIPTIGYIAELRNVQLNQVIDLTAINVGNGLVIEGWYYDQLFTNKVSTPSYVVVTEAIIKSGLYPKYLSDYVTPDNGNPWPDSGNNYNPDLSGNPSTIVSNLTQLF